MNASGVETASHPRDRVIASVVSVALARPPVPGVECLVEKEGRKVKCKTCKYFSLAETHEDVYHLGTVGSSGTCRIMPPVIVPLGVTQFPVVSANTWCGWHEELSHE